MSLIIALPRERRPSERRVALDPSRVERLIQSGLQVRIEAECGHSASFHDDDYQGATVHDSFAEVVRGADIIVKVVCPTLDEISELRAGSVLICSMSAFQHVNEVEALRLGRITVLAMDHMPRTTRAQPMDALSSQATVAGYKAALLAAELSPRMFPMLTTAAGTIRPSRVLVIGAGVAGLQAIATARRLGAQVEGYDIRRAAKEQIESLGARMVDTGVEVEGAGGFARALRKDERQKQHDVLAEHLARAHVVICAASIPGRNAPRIITEDMVDGMLPESVIVDLAASTGGNCELTHVGEHYYHHETLIVGPLNLPSHGAVHASEMYGRNVYNMLQLVIRHDEVVLDPDDDIIARCVVCHDGNVNHGPTASLMETEHVAFGGAVHVASDFPDQSAGWLVEPEDHTDANGVDREPAEDALTAVSESGSAIDGAPTDLVARTGDDQANQVELSAPGDVKGSDLADLDHLQVMENVDDLQALDGLTIQPSEPIEEESQADDFTRINGVGPALQECLYSFGFRRFEDIAVLDDAGVQKLTVQLELDDEVEKQDWTGQARKLMEQLTI
ncbi:MAG: hypothetical protein AB8B97_07660 [Granulosicoccus sp.]